MTVQVFISYARLDNKVPRGAEPKPGFISILHEYLVHELSQLPKPRPALWRDAGNIERTEQFEEILETEVAHSDFLVVVFSHNWLDSDWCKRELARFSERWASDGEAGIRRRILLVNKTPVDRNRRPALLQGQEGHDFFSIDPEQYEGARVRPYFDFGKVLDQRFEDQVRELASRLQRLAAEQVGGRPERREIPASAPVRAMRPQIGRGVFVAQPADDMRQAYERIANELRGRGFTVLPEAEIPNDESAVAFINRALAAAELSVHALGEKRGFAPPEQDPIVQLQLALAAARVREPVREEKGSALFRRIIWAPKILEGGASEGPAVAPSLAARDPLAVLGKFGDRVLEGDNVLGDNLSRFIDFLIRHLEQTAPRLAPTAAPIEAGAQIYIDHEEKDAAYAADVAAALQQRAIGVATPVFDGTKTEKARVNRRQMQACDAFALCWAKATESWAVAHALQLMEWRPSGRTKKFPTALLLGPPRIDRKAARATIKPPGVDSVVDLTNCEKPCPQDLDAWLGPSPSAASGRAAGA